MSGRLVTLPRQVNVGHIGAAAREADDRGVANLIAETEVDFFEVRAAGRHDNDGKIGRRVASAEVEGLGLEVAEVRECWFEQQRE